MIEKIKCISSNSTPFLRDESVIKGNDVTSLNEPSFSRDSQNSPTRAPAWMLIQPSLD